LRFEITGKKEFLTKFKNQIKASYNEIITRLGKNSDIRFVKEYNPSTTNFILRIKISAMFQEIPLNENVEGAITNDGEYIHGVYYVRTIFQLDDPHSNKIVTMFPMHQAKYKTNNHLSADYIFRDYWELFLNVALPRSNADKLKDIIKPEITYSEVEPKITYKAENDKEPKADGKQKGDIKVKMTFATGEARNNSITRFKLICEKGIFTKTNSKEIEFTGADYYFGNYGGENTFETKYKTYDCKKYEDSKKEFDTFTLVQLQRLSEEFEQELKVEEINFKCEKTYDIFATYNAPGFAKAKLVWRNTTIRFPNKGEEIQQFNAMAFRDSGATGEPVGTDGKPLALPYTSITPYANETIYGWPENEYAIPEIISISSLGGKGAFSRFKVVLDEDALNMCDIMQINKGPIFLSFQFDLFGKYKNADTDYWEQVTIACMEAPIFNKIKGINAKFPTEFKQINFSESDINNFKEYKEFEKTISNGYATLKIEFKISEEN